MTKKHYEAIAKIIAEVKDRPKHQHRQIIAESLAFYFEHENARFQSQRFLTACDAYMQKCPECNANIDPNYNCCFSTDCDYMQ